jgi:hypothetical protein
MASTAPSMDGLRGAARALAAPLRPRALPGARAGAPSARRDRRGAAALGSLWHAFTQQRMQHALLRGSSS